eukprot:4474092-Pyramimonas_sp.AAC.1
MVSSAGGQLLIHTFSLGLATALAALSLTAHSVGSPPIAAHIASLCTEFIVATFSTSTTIL